MNYINNRLFVFYIVILCWLPLPLASKSILAQQFFVFLISLLCCFCCYQLYRHNQRPLPTPANKAKPVYVLFVLFFLSIAFQILPLPFQTVSSLSPIRAQFLGFKTGSDHLTLSFNPGASLHSLLLGIGYFELFIATLLIIDSQDRLKKLLYALLFIGVAQAIYGSLMTLSGIEKELWFDKTGHIGFATGTLLNRNHFANYLTYSVASSIGLLLSLPSNPTPVTWRAWARSVTGWLLGTKGFIRLSIIIMVIGIILTRSRMGNTAFLSSLTITGFLWLVLSRKLNASLLILFCSLLLIDLVLMGSWFGVDKIIDRIENTNSDEEMRHQMLPYMQDMANDFWLTGTGSGTFANTFPLYKKLVTDRHYNEAHCDYLQFFIENGLVGTMLLAAIVLLSLAKTLQTIRQRHSRLLVAAGFSILMALIATGIHASVEYTLQRPATASLFVVFLALPWITAHLESETGKRSRHGKAA